MTSTPAAYNVVSGVIYLAVRLFREDSKVVDLREQGVHQVFGVGGDTTGIPPIADHGETHPPLLIPEDNLLPDRIITLNRRGIDPLVEISNDR
jgi:hypothetical protein